MAVAVVLVALILAAAIVGAVVFVVRWLAPFWDRELRVKEKLAGMAETEQPIIHIPGDILAHIHRFPRKESRESEEAFAREIFLKTGRWEDVRLSIGMADPEATE